MDYRQYLFKPLSNLYIDILVQVIFTNPSEFQKVYNLIFDSEEKVAWRAAWACQKISEKNPTWFTENQYLELVELVTTTSHNGLQRGCLSILYNLDLPSVIPVNLINSCFEWMISPQYPIAVQAISMKLLYKICKKEPDFTNEFRINIESISPDDYSKGFNAARNKILKELIAK